MLKLGAQSMRIASYPSKTPSASASASIRWMRGYLGLACWKRAPPRPAARGTPGTDVRGDRPLAHTALVVDARHDARRHAHDSAVPRRPPEGRSRRGLQFTIMTIERWALGADLSVARIGYGAMKLTGW